MDTGFSAAGMPEAHISSEDLAGAVLYVLGRPAEVDLSTVVVRPRRQML